jgi:hypothetical protein
LLEYVSTLLKKWGLSGCIGIGKQANYINALAVSVLPFFEPAKGTLGGFFSSLWVDFLTTLGELFYDIG